MGCFSLKISDIPAVSNFNTFWLSQVFSALPILENSICLLISQGSD